MPLTGRKLRALSASWQTRGLRDAGNRPEGPRHTGRPANGQSSPG